MFTTYDIKTAKLLEMAQSDSFNRKDVKLTSLRVVDFKKLKNQKISWNFQQPGDLGVIGVKDFYGEYSFQQFHGEQIRMDRNSRKFIRSQNERRYSKRSNLVLATTPMQRKPRSL